MPDVVLSMEALEDHRERVYDGAEAADIRLYRKYASGEHAKVMSTEMRKILGVTKPNVVADNILDLVLRTKAGRLTFEAWECEDDQTVADYLAGVYIKSRLEAIQFDTHYAALRDGMTANSLRWRPPRNPNDPNDRGRVSVHREQWWDGREGMFVAFDDFGDPIWAFRDWYEVIGRKEYLRRTVYYPDEIQRFIQDNGRPAGARGVRARPSPGGWKPYRLAGDPEGGPDGIVRWLKRDGTPLGLPIIPFANAAADTGFYGRSDIAGLIGVQDDINQIGLDITAAAMFTGFQMYWAAGVTIDELRSKVGPGRILSSDKESAKFGTLPPGPMDSLIEAYESKRQTIAVDTAVPMHQIGGQWPSGEALLRSEMPLVDSTKRFGAVEAPSWVMLGHRSTEMENTFGPDNLDEEAFVSVRYSAPERLDELTEIQVKQATVSLYSSLGNIADPELLVKTGLVDDTEAKAIMAGRAERDAALAESASSF